MFNKRVFALAVAVALWLAMPPLPSVASTSAAAQSILNAISTINQQHANQVGQAQQWDVAGIKAFQDYSDRYEAAMSDVQTDQVIAQLLAQQPPARLNYRSYLDQVQQMRDYYQIIAQLSRSAAHDYGDEDPRFSVQGQEIGLLFTQALKSASPAQEPLLVYYAASAFQNAAWGDVHNLGSATLAQQHMGEVGPLFDYIVSHASSYDPAAIAEFKENLHDVCDYATSATGARARWDAMPVCLSPNRGW